AIKGPGRKWSDAGRLHRPVERAVKDIEPLEMGAIPRPVDIQERHDQARFFGITSDSAGGLDVFGTHLGLPKDDHQAEAHDVESDGNHVGCYRDIDAVLYVKQQVKPALRFSHKARMDPRGQLDHFIRDRSARERPLLLAEPLAV